MNGCHKCPHAPRIEAHEFDGIDWNRCPCSRCPEFKEDAASARTLRYDDGRDTPGTGGHGSTSLIAGTTEAGGRTVDPALPISVLAEAVRGFLELPPKTFRLLQRRFLGDSYRLIAEEQNISPQAVEIQLRRALEAHPHLKSLLPGKAKRQEARRSKQLSMSRRGKPGAGK